MRIKLRDVVVFGTLMMVLSSTLLPASSSAAVYGDGAMQGISEAVDRFEKADAAMNQAYRKLLPLMDKEGKSKLIISQKAWLKFRDTQAEFEMDWYRGGTLAKSQYHDTRTKLTENRTKELLEAIEVKNM